MLILLLSTAPAQSMEKQEPLASTQGFYGYLFGGKSMLKNSGASKRQKIRSELVEFLKQYPGYKVCQVHYWSFLGWICASCLLWRATIPVLQDVPSPAHLFKLFLVACDDDLCFLMRSLHAPFRFGDVGLRTLSRFGNVGHINV